MSVISLRLPDELEAQLIKLASAMGRSKSWLAAQAVKQYISQEEWQIQEITQALQEADAGDFSSNEEIAEKYQKWGINGN